MENSSPVTPLRATQAPQRARSGAACSRATRAWRWACAALLLMIRVASESSWAQTAESPPPQPAAQPVSGWHVKVEDRARVPVGIEGAEPVVFGGWALSGRGRWADAGGLSWDAERADPLVRSSALTPSLAALGPSWTFELRGSRRGTAGLQWSLRAGATNGWRATPTLLAATDSALFANSLDSLDPGARRTLWHAGVSVERAFSVGAADVTLFGEALLEGGSGPAGCRSRPDRCGEKLSVPVKVTTGVKLGF